MATESGNGFINRYRMAIGLGTAAAAVVLLVVLYKATAPRSPQTTTASGDRIPESEVLQVGALPVT